MDGMEAKRIFVDMDDTICQYTKARQEALKLNPSVEYPQSVLGFYKNLKPMRDVKAWLYLLQCLGHDVWILTRPSTKNRHCYTEKADWVYENLGEEWLSKLIFSPDKALVKGDILIDDVPWVDFEGTQILYGSKEYPTWARVYSAISKMN